MFDIAELTHPSNIIILCLLNILAAMQIQLLLYGCSKETAVVLHFISTGC